KEANSKHKASRFRSLLFRYLNLFRVSDFEFRISSLEIPLMKNFTYYRPGTVEQAVGLLEQRFGNTELLAGGTDLLALQKNYVAQPARVVSLTAVKGFNAIEETQGGAAFNIGAGATLSAIA